MKGAKRSKKRAKEEFSIVDSYYLVLRRLNNLLKKEKKKEYAFRIIGRALYLGSVIAMKESEDRYKIDTSADRAFEVRCLTESLGYACHLIRSGARVSTIEDKLERRIKNKLGVSIDEVPGGDNDRIFYIITRNLRKTLDKDGFYSLVGNKIRETFFKGEYTHCDFLSGYFDEDERYRMGFVGGKLVDQEQLIRKTLVDLLESSRRRII